MLSYNLKLHREYIQAELANQKLFASIELAPFQEIRNKKSKKAVIFVIDASGSMQEICTQPTKVTDQEVIMDNKTYRIAEGGKTKLHVVMESLSSVFKNELIQSGDKVGIIGFDDRTKILFNLSEKFYNDEINQAINKLTTFGGGTDMAPAMAKAIEELNKCSPDFVKKVILFTDGETINPEKCVEAANTAKKSNIVIEPYGVGVEYNYELLENIANTTSGTESHLQPDMTLKDGRTFQQAIAEDITSSSYEVITNVKVKLDISKGCQLDWIKRVLPTIIEIKTEDNTANLGNITSKDQNVFVVSFDLPSRPEIKVRIANLTLSYNVPSLNKYELKAELPIVVQFTKNPNLYSKINNDVVQFVQQLNAQQLIKQAATMVLKGDTVSASKTLNLAKSITQKLGNNVLTKVLSDAENELKTNKTISLNTSKTMRVEAKTKTMKLQGQSSGQIQLSEEEIRRILGV